MDVRADLDLLGRDHETVCQLCGVSFAISRIRTSGEDPESSAWGNGCRGFNWVVGTAGEDGRGGLCSDETGCVLAFRGNPVYWVDDEPRIIQWLYTSDRSDRVYKYKADTDDEVLEYQSDCSSDAEMDGSSVDGSSLMEDSPNPPEQESGDTTDSWRGPNWTFTVNARNEEYDSTIGAFRPLSIKIWGNKDGRYKKHEHIAGPDCQDSRGYHGSRISVEEMWGFDNLQCLLGKLDGWEPWEDDLDFERYGDHFLTGLCDRMTSGGDSYIYPYPRRHGVVSFHALMEVEDWTPVCLSLVATVLLCRLSTWKLYLTYALCRTVLILLSVACRSILPASSYSVRLAAGSMVAWISMPW